MTIPETRGGMRRRGPLPITYLFPNMVTVGGLCCGASSIRFAMSGKWEVALGFLLAAALLDAMDGLVARLLKATSNFGAQLDSLSDVICFGVAPALIFYLWALSDFKRFGWAAVLFFIVCCALRLARFNSMLQDDSKDKALSRRFFTGVPAPAGAILAVAPIMAAFPTDDYSGFNLFEIHPSLGALYLVAIGLLMASRIPTFAAKNIRIGANSVPYVMLGMALVLALLVIAPWTTMVTLAVLYLVSLPFSAAAYRKARRQTASIDASGAPR